MTAPVVIVGAGPTGASAAILLATHGVSSVVLDRWHDVYPQPRAVHLDDEVFSILGRMGVAGEFAAVSRPGAGLRLLDRELRVLGEFGRLGVSPTTGYPRASMFDQPDLEAVLRRRIAQLDDIELRGGTEVVGVDGTRVRTRDVRTGRQETIEASYVLGCDGARSLVREAIGSRMIDLGFEQRWIVIDIETDHELGQWPGVHQVCDSRRAATYMQIGGSRHRWELQMLPAESAADFATIEDLLPFLRPWTGDLAGADLRIVRTAEYTFRAQVADRWRRDRVFLLGDAAHLTPPFIGQGLGAGVRDAANLAWKLAGVLRGSLAAEALQTYEVERAPHARSLVELARMTGRAMTGGGRAGDLLRLVAVPAMQVIPSIRAAVADSVTPPLRGSDLVWARRRDPLAGRLAPNEGLRPGWNLVTTEPAAPSDLRTLTQRRVEIVTTPALARWLRDAGAAAAVVRPDGTVMTSTRRAVDAVTAVTGVLAPETQGVR